MPRSSSGHYSKGLKGFKFGKSRTVGHPTDKEYFSSCVGTRFSVKIISFPEGRYNVGQKTHNTFKYAREGTILGLFIVLIIIFLCSFAISLVFLTLSVDTWERFLVRDTQCNKTSHFL